ncbi:hypothetical protein [uncultured Pseudodesulfovibrio sp.]|uniref:hypothetical protein n=1 Tax=uncultured Pseudodesulfovibrio sp. TaxID=2035858 RepID=UPI0029C8BC0C|nr:hypothetical protein [uncultured Pseudodesulfovibrio sp.]
MLVFKDAAAPGCDVRIVGLEMDHGVLKVVTATDIPPQISSSLGYSCGYFTQLFYIKENKIILKGQSESTVLDLQNTEWSEQTMLRAGYFEGTPDSQRSSPIKTEAHYSIAHRSREKLCGKEREVMEISLRVHTERFGTAGSSNYFFVSGLGMIAFDLSKLTQIRHLNSMELQRFKEDHDNFLREKQ